MTSLSEHPAFRAWSGLRLNNPELEGIEVVRRKKKSAIYRLLGAGPAGSAVIAKRCVRESAWIERTVYSDILPRLNVSSPQYYGFVEEPDGEYYWLFVEDAGRKEYGPRLKQHEELIARWLGQMHTGTASLGRLAPLPDRGPSHYLKHLQSARETILGNLALPELEAGDVALLETIISQCDFLESRWNRIEGFCDEFPRALVHGDLSVKNMRVRNTEAGSALLVFDWETAGWGVPAADLSQLPMKLPARPDLTHYWTTVRDSWTQLRMEGIQQLAAVGSMFRLLAMLHWESLDLQYASVRKSMGSMKVYRIEMAQAMRNVGWKDGPGD
jgi:hypothetical protein